MCVCVKEGKRDQPTPPPKPPPSSRLGHALTQDGSVEKLTKRQQGERKAEKLLKKREK